MWNIGIAYNAGVDFGDVVKGFNDGRAYATFKRWEQADATTDPSAGLLWRASV
jgi:hypothetical protein